MSVAAKAAIKAPRATALLAAIVPFSVRVRLLVASAGSDKIGKTDTNGPASCRGGLIGAEFLPAGFCGEQENHLFVRQKENSRGKRHLNATGAVGKEVKASNVSISVCRPVCQVPVVSPSHQLLQQRVSSSSFLCRVQTLFLIAFRNKSSRESRPVVERANPSVRHAGDHQPDLLFSARV